MPLRGGLSVGRGATPTTTTTPKGWILGGRRWRGCCGGVRVDGSLGRRSFAGALPSSGPALERLRAAARAPAWLPLRTHSTHPASAASTGGADAAAIDHYRPRLQTHTQGNFRAPAPPSDQELLWDILLLCAGQDGRYPDTALVAFAGRPSSSLVVLTGQLIIRRNRAALPPAICSALLPGPAFSDSVAKSGVPLATLISWAAILEPADPHERVRRFLAHAQPKPEFILRTLLRGATLFPDRASLQSLIRYAFLAHWRGTCAWAPPPHKTMRCSAFVDLIGRLVFHCRRWWPRQIPIVALLAQSFLRCPGVEYRDIVDAYNSMLQIFARPAFERAAYNIQHNWRAQQTLLTACERLGHDVLMDRASYRAVRSVLLACKKTYGEQDVASRHLDSWPPYVAPRDGMDEHRDRDYDYSSAARVGSMMRGAGFAFEEGDVMLDVLAGRAPDDTVTIRQRRPVSEKAMAAASWANTWAARVAATRNASEAWVQFQRRPPGRCDDGGPIPVEVYGEMFAKLLDPPLQPSQIDLLPGDGPVQFPAPQANLTPYGESILRPPRMRDLYVDMIKSGVQPEGFCLRVLMRSPRSLTAVHGYLQSSTLDQRAVRTLVGVQPSAELLQLLDMRIVHAYVSVLCRMQPQCHHRQWRGALRRQPVHLLGVAYRIMMRRVNPAQHPTWFRSFGRRILAGLARPGTLLDPRVDRRGNRFLALARFMGLLSVMRERVGADMAMFDLARTMVQHALEPRIRLAWSPAVGGRRVESFFWSDVVEGESKVAPRHVGTTSGVVTSRKHIPKDKERLGKGAAATRRARQGQSGKDWSTGRSKTADGDGGAGKGTTVDETTEDWAVGRYNFADEGELAAAADAVFATFDGHAPRNDAEAADLLSRSVRALRLMFRQMIATHPVSSSRGLVVDPALVEAVASFSSVVRPPLEAVGVADDADADGAPASPAAAWRPPPQEAAQAAMLHKYMRTLAFVGDWDEMAWLLRWMAGIGGPDLDMYGAWDEEDVLDRERGWGFTHSVHLKRALCAFRAFGEAAWAVGGEGRGKEWALPWSADLGLPVPLERGGLLEGKADGSGAESVGDGSEPLPGGKGASADGSRMSGDSDSGSGSGSDGDLSGGGDGDFAKQMDSSKGPTPSNTHHHRRSLGHRRAQKLSSLVASVKAKKCTPQHPGGDAAWAWPTDEDVAEYLAGDTRQRMGAMLCDVIRATRHCGEDEASAGADKVQTKKKTRRGPRRKGRVELVRLVEKEVHGEVVAEGGDKVEAKEPWFPKKLSIWERLRGKSWRGGGEK